MDCSTNSLTYVDPWFYNFGNGTTLYCNGSYPMNWVCNATIKADPDIAGPGIIASFVLVAWITLGVAAIPAFYDLLKFIDRVKEHTWHSSTIITEKRRSISNTRRISQLRRTLNLDRTASLRKAASGLLGSLCDLQIITGLAIVIAGLAQIPAISFYHEELAMNYWWLTLNSFWAARIEYMDDSPFNYTKRGIIRQIGVLVSVILAMIFQCIIIVRESRAWFFLRPGYCYLNHDHSSSWPWVGGTSLYAASLSLSITPATRPWINRYSKALQCIQGMLIKQWRKSLTILQTNHLRFASGYDLSAARSLLRVVLWMGVFGLLSLCVAVYWLLVQFLAIWSYGDGFNPLLMISYIAFAAWNTFDIFDLKFSNRYLIDGQETSWGFGQVLPMVLPLMIGYNAIDAFEGKDAPVDSA